LTPIKIFGISLIMLGSMIGIRQPRQPLPTAADIGQDASSTLTPKSVGAAASEIVFKPRYAEGYTFALLSVTGYGVSPLFIRMALQNTGIGASLAGGLISYVAATLVIM